MVRKCIFHLGLTLFQFLSILAILTQLLFYINIRAGLLSLAASACISVLLLIYSVYHQERAGETEGVLKRALSISLIVIISSILIMLLSSGFGSLFFDETHDSNNYHKPYALFFANGFNPVYDQNPPVVFGIEWGNNLFVQFPKAAEIIGSYFYQISGSLESVKAINLIACISALIITFYTLLLFLPKRRITAGILASALVLSPIWITQSTTFYIDGFYYELILIVLSLMLFFIKEKASDTILLTIIVGSILLINTKGSSLLFVPIFLLFFGYLLYTYKPEIWKKVIITSVIIILILTLLTGFPTYFSHFERYVDEFSIYMNPFGENAVMEHRNQDDGNPLGNHSITGIKGIVPSAPSLISSTSLQKIDENPPQGTMANTSGDESGVFSKVSKWLLPREMFIRYHFSPVSQEYAGMKSPFDINMSELTELTGENRVNGYGPFLGLIILLSFITLISAFIFRENGDNNLRILSIAILFILISVILHPAVFWDRYVPQLYIIFGLIALIGLLSRISAINLLAYMIIAIMLINALCVGAYWYPVSLEKSTVFYNVLDGIKDSTVEPVYLIHSTESTRDDISDPFYRLTNIAFFQEWKIAWKDGTNEKISEPNFTVPLFFETDAIVIPKSTEYQVDTMIPPTVIGRYAIEGFAPTQGAYIWTDKRNVSLKLTINNPPDIAYLKLNALPLHMDERSVDQIIWVTVNNQTLAKPYSLTKIEENRLVIPIPPHALLNGENIIRFKLPYAQKLPKGLYGMSVRSIGITSTP